MKNADMLCELLTPISPTEALGYVNDDRYAMQVKEDGFRLVVERYMGGLMGFDREGKITAIPEHLLPALDRFADDYMIDGEIVSMGAGTKVYVVWDILRLDDEDMRRWPYQERLQELYFRLGAGSAFGLILSRAWFSSIEKTKALLNLSQAGAEGVVFKDLLAIFVPGRSGQHYKLKFWESATCRVAAKSLRADRRDDKHSIALELMDASDVWTPMGFVTVPRSAALPAPGTLVEVRYLYAQSGGLYQPVYIGIRTDLQPSACTLAQLKWKSERDEYVSAT